MTTEIPHFTGAAWAVGTLAALAALAVLLAPFATADNAADNQYLAALHHGGL